MLKKAFYFIILTVISYLIGSQLKSYLVKLSTPGDIVFLEDIYDFDELKYGQEASVYFKYKNVGSKEIEISEVLSTCGCTVPEWKETPLEPNEIDSLLVRYDTKLIGYFSKEITVSSNGTSDQDRVWITGTVLNPEDSIKN
ncbi:DUF1573 domain-containing protein [Roseivirga echinicomitans]